jgi:branched chain amino acid efflux pump
VFALTNDRMVFIIVDMRSMWRTLSPAMRRDVLALCCADMVVGVSFGAIAVASGLSWWMPSMLSVLVFAGGAQFMVVGVVAAGGGVVAAVLGALVLNVRHLPFGLAIGPIMGSSWPARLVGSQLLVDETVAFAMAERDPRRARAVFWVCGALLFVLWNAATVAGALAGQVLGDPDALGLDAAFPAALLALVLPSLRGRPRARNAALLGAAIALAATQLLPAGLPVLLALAGLVVLIPRPPAARTSRTGRYEPDATARVDTGEAER